MYRTALRISGKYAHFPTNDRSGARGGKRSDFSSLNSPSSHPLWNSSIAPELTPCLAPCRAASCGQALRFPGDCGAEGTAPRSRLGGRYKPSRHLAIAVLSRNASAKCHWASHITWCCETLHRGPADPSCPLKTPLTSPSPTPPTLCWGSILSLWQSLNFTWAAEKPWITTSGFFCFGVQHTFKLYSLIWR